MKPTFPFLLEQGCNLLAQVSKSLLELETKLAAIYHFHAYQYAVVAEALGIDGYACSMIFVEVSASLPAQTRMEANDSLER